MDAERKPSGAVSLRVQQVLLCLERDYPQSDLCLSSVAKSLRLSPCYVSRILTGATGKHFRQTLRDIRMKHAAELLKNTRFSVKEVSWAVGYAHHSSFDRDFRSEFGKSPLEARCDWMQQ